MAFTSPLGANPLAGITYATEYPTPTTADTTTTRFDEFRSLPQIQYTDPFANFAQTHYHLSQQNGNKELLIRTAITGQIVEDARNKFYTAKIFPLVPTTSSMIAYSTLEFVNTIADVTPVEGVPRITETKMTSGRKALTRRAHGLFVEHEYTRTAEGRKMYQMNMRHLATIVAETMCRDAIMALIEGDDDNVTIGERSDSIGNIKNVEDVLRQEINRWGIIQKASHGFAKLDAEVCRLTDRYGMSNLMNTWIFPKEIDVFLRTTPKEHTSYKEGGQDAVNQITSSIGHLYDDVKPALIYGNVYDIYYARTFIGSERGPENPMTRTRHIGEYFPMIPFTDEQGKNYQTTHRDIRVYDENRDCYQIITMNDALNADVIFDMDGRLKTTEELHRSHVSEREVDLNECFMYKPRDSSADRFEYDPIKCIGEIKKKFLQTNDVIEMARSMVAAVARTFDCSKECADGELYNDIETGLKLVAEYQSKGVEGWLRVVPAFDRTEPSKNAMRIREIYPDNREVNSTVKYVTEFDETSGATISSFMEPKDSNSEDIFTGINPQDVYPYMTNWAGLKYLASRKFTDKFPLKADTHTTITRFVNAVERLVSFMSNNLDQNPLVNSKYSMPWALIPSAEQVFLSTVPQFADSYPVDFMMGPPEDVTVPLTEATTITRGVKNDRLPKEIYSNLQAVISNLKIPQDMTLNYLNAISVLVKIFELFQENYSIHTLYMTAALMIKQIFAKKFRTEDDLIETYVHAYTEVTGRETDTARVQQETGSLDPDTAKRVDDASNEYLATHMLGDFGFFSDVNYVTIITDTTLKYQSMLVQTFEALLDDLKDLSKEDLESARGTLDKYFKILPFGVIQDYDTTEKYILKQIESSTDLNKSFVEIITEICNFGTSLPNYKQKWRQTLDENREISKRLKSSPVKIITRKFTESTQKHSVSKKEKIAGGISKNAHNLDLTTARAGWKYVRSSFTLTKKQIAEYVQLVQDPILGDFFRKEPGSDTLWMTVSLPSSGYNTPASLSELENFTSDYNNRDLKRQLSTDLIRKMEMTKKGVTYNPNVTTEFESMRNKYRKFLLDQSKDENFFWQYESHVNSNVISNMIGTVLGHTLRFNDGLASNKEQDDEFSEELITIVRFGEFLKKTKDFQKKGKTSSVSIDGGEDPSLFEDREAPPRQASQTLTSVTENLNTPTNIETPATINEKIRFDVAGKNKGGGSKRARHEKESFEKHRKKARTEHPTSQFLEVALGLRGGEHVSYLDNSVNLIFYSHSEHNCYIDNPNFMEHWDAIKKQTNLFSLEKLVSYAILTTPFNKNVLQSFIHHNIILPLNYLIFRPHQRYLTALGVKCRAGTDMGATFYNPEQSNLMEEDRATTKTRMTHYSWYSRAVVTNPKLVHRAWDIFIMDTLGGAGVGFYTAEDLETGRYIPHQHQYTDENSIFAVMIAYRERRNDIKDVIDASGRFNYWNIGGFRDLSQKNRPHYSTAPIYNGFWGWRVADQSVDYSNEFHPLSLTNSEMPVNTAMWQGPYVCYDPRSKREVAIPGKGHFESFAYPGCKNLRKGGSKEWEMPEIFKMGVLR